MSTKSKKCSVGKSQEIKIELMSYRDLVSTGATSYSSINCLFSSPSSFFAESNNVMGANLINILFYRQHKHIAAELHKLNPSWNDDRLFYTARDINIAVSLQIYLYELLPALLGSFDIF